MDSDLTVAHEAPVESVEMLTTSRHHPRPIESFLTKGFSDAADLVAGLIVLDQIVQYSDLDEVMLRFGWSGLRH